ncbi:MAG: hypothetical protein EHM13_14890 [Acidobacteria bacterium]|nr:MAG: hypothetical protein EHM13_14890 [Acidobacteriota bacterium]
MRNIVLTVVFGLLVFGTVLPATPPVESAPSISPSATQPQERPIYLVYYWRARPGRAAEYGDYIRNVAEPIDENARKAGVFEEVHTYTPAVVTGAPGADWTHMRVFRLKGYAALDRFSQSMDEATRRVVPDANQRARNSQHSSELRDLVRQEIWQDFR